MPPSAQIIQYGVLALVGTSSADLLDQRRAAHQAPREECGIRDPLVVLHD